MNITASQDSDLEFTKQRLLREALWGKGRQKRISITLAVLLGFVLTRIIDGEFLDALLRIGVGTVLFSFVEIAAKVQKTYSSFGLMTHVGGYKNRIGKRTRPRRISHRLQLKRTMKEQINIRLWLNQKGWLHKKGNPLVQMVEPKTAYER